jgi:hypothetical protein
VIRTIGLGLGAQASKRRRRQMTSMELDTGASLVVSLSDAYVFVIVVLIHGNNYFCCRFVSVVELKLDNFEDGVDAGRNDATHCQHSLV